MWRARRTTLHINVTNNIASKAKHSGVGICRIRDVRQLLRRHSEHHGEHCQDFRFTSYAQRDVRILDVRARIK